MVTLRLCGYQSGVSNVNRSVINQTKSWLGSTTGCVGVSYTVYRYTYIVRYKPNHGMGLLLQGTGYNKRHYLTRCHIQYTDIRI